MCLHEFMCAMWTCGKQKRVSDPLELELHVSAGNLPQVLGKSSKSFELQSHLFSFSLYNFQDNCSCGKL